MSAVAIAEDGHVLAMHVCSSEGFMRHDLGVSGSDWKHENYDKHFGAGNWEISWVDEPKKHEALQRAFELNKAIGVSEDVIPKASVTLVDENGVESTIVSAL